MASRDTWFDKVGAIDKIATQGDCQQLDYTHGIEVEYFLVDREGKKLPQADFGEVYNSLLYDSLIDAMEKKIPAFYSNKLSSINIGPSKSSTYDALYIVYKTRGNNVKTELVSVDRNVVEWPLVELATPPCESLYELGWWSSAVLELINTRLKKLGNKNHLLAFGVNPYEKIEDITQSDSFATCGEHHHLKLIDQKSISFDEKAFFTNYYHLVRYLLPYMILLSASSPFASGGLWGKYRPNDLELPFPRCVRSIRILYNKKHLCNFQDGEYMPYLEKGWMDRGYFISEFRKQSNSYRRDTHFLDMDPYSKTSTTTEIRFFDTQPSIARRIGLAAILQMLTRKAKKLLVKEGDSVLELLKEPNINLQAIKKMACEGGNWFRPSKESIFGKHNSVGKLKKSIIERSVLSDLVLQMLHFLREEINDNNLIYSHFLDPIRHSIYGLNGNGISPAQYWLMVYINQDQDTFRVVNRIIESTKKGTDMWYDPIVSEPVTFNQINSGGSR